MLDLTVVAGDLIATSVAAAGSFGRADLQRRLLLKEVPNRKAGEPGADRIAEIQLVVAE